MSKLESSFMWPQFTSCVQGKGYFQRRCWEVDGDVPKEPKSETIRTMQWVRPLLSQDIKEVVLQPHSDQAPCTYIKVLDGHSCKVE